MLHVFNVCVFNAFGRNKIQMHQCPEKFKNWEGRGKAELCSVAPGCYANGTTSFPDMGTRLILDCVQMADDGRRSSKEGN